MTQPGLPDGVVAQIQLAIGRAPLDVAEAAGSVWVTNHRGPTLYRIDPASNKVTQRVDLGQDTGGVTGYAFDLLWIPGQADSDHATVVDPVKGEVVGTIPSKAGLGFAPDAVWTATDYGPSGTIRIDPVSLTPMAPLANPVPGADSYIYVDGVDVRHVHRPSEDREARPHDRRGPRDGASAELQP